MPRIYRIEVSRIGALIDDATPLRNALAYPTALVTTGPDTPQARRSASASSGAARDVSMTNTAHGRTQCNESEDRDEPTQLSFGSSSERRLRARSHNVASKTRFYTIGSPSPRYKLPPVDEGSAPFEFPVSVSIDPEQQAKFDADERFYANAYGGRPADAVAGPSRSVAVNTPINYFGSISIRDMPVRDRLCSPRSLSSMLVSDERNAEPVNSANNEAAEKDESFRVTTVSNARSPMMGKEEDISFENSGDGGGGVSTSNTLRNSATTGLLRDDSPVNASVYPPIDAVDDSYPPLLELGDRESLPSSRNTGGRGKSLENPEENNYSGGNDTVHVEDVEEGELSPAPLQREEADDHSPLEEASPSPIPLRNQSIEPAAEEILREGEGEGSEYQTQGAAEGSQKQKLLASSSAEIEEHEKSPIHFSSTRRGAGKDDDRDEDRSGNAKPIISPRSEHGFQSETRMSVRIPLDISPVLDRYRAACVAFNASQKGPNHCRSRLRAESDIDRLRMVLSTALSCSRALRQLSETLAPNHPIAREAFTLEEKKDVVTDATFERLLDMQAADLAVLQQALAVQEDLLKGRQIAQDGLIDYQRAALASRGLGSEEEMLMAVDDGGANLETIASSLEKRAQEIHESALLTFPNASVTESNLVVLCAVIGSIETDAKLIERVEREQASITAQRFLESSGIAASSPPVIDMPKLRKIISSISNDYLSLANNKLSHPEGREDGRGRERSVGGQELRKGISSSQTFKYFVQPVPRATFSAYFRNARRVAGDSPDSAAGLEALRTFIRSADQAKKVVLDPLDSVIEARKTSSSQAQGGGDDGPSTFASSSPTEVADENAAKRVKQRAAATSIISACETMARKSQDRILSIANFKELVELLTPNVLWQMRKKSSKANLFEEQGVPDNLAEEDGEGYTVSTPHAFSPQGLKEAYLAELCNAAYEYRRAFKRSCEAETVLIAFEDCTDAYVKACFDAGVPTPAGRSLSRSHSPSSHSNNTNNLLLAGRASISAARASSTQQFEQEMARQDAALAKFLDSLSTVNTTIRAQISRNKAYMRERKTVFKMLVTQLRFLKKLDQVPLYFPPEFVLTATDGSKGVIGRERSELEEREETLYKLQLLKNVAKVNSEMAQACLMSLANSLVTIRKPDEDEALRIKAEEENTARVPRFLSVLSNMQLAEEELSKALFACKRYVLKRDANALASSGSTRFTMTGRGGGGGFEGSHSALFGTRGSAGAFSPPFYMSPVEGELGGTSRTQLASSLSGAGSPKAASPLFSETAVFLFGPASQPVPRLQAELFRSNLRKLIDPGVLIFMKSQSGTAEGGGGRRFQRYTISFHKESLDRLLLIPQASASSSSIEEEVIPIPFAMIEMLTRGPTVNDDIASGGVGDLQTMRLHFDRKALVGLVRLDAEGKSMGVTNQKALEMYDSCESAQQSNARMRIQGAGTTANLIPLLAPVGAPIRRILEVYFPSFASFQQWSDAFQMLIENKKYLGPSVGQYMLR